MNALDRPEDVRAYYRADAVVDRYIDRRTTEPFNGFLHSSQVRFLNRAIDERGPQRVLEIAPGPARFTAEIDAATPLVAMDASAEMLALARQRLRATYRRYPLLQGDAFDLPFTASAFDFVIVLKLIRHFRQDRRLHLYSEIHRVLAPGGALVLDAQNRAVKVPRRARRASSEYPLYDARYDRTELADELSSAGFRVVRMRGIARHSRWQRQLNRMRRFGLGGPAGLLIGLLEKLPGGVPSTWMILGEREK